VVGAVVAIGGTMAVAPATAEPRQGASGHGIVSVHLVRSNNSYTWGPWTLKGHWDADDGSSFTGTLTGGTSTSTPPTPSFYIPEFAVAGQNSTGAVSGGCQATVTSTPLAKVSSLESYCRLDFAGATLGADDPGTMTLVQVGRTNTADGYVIDYRGEF
jgi:hypothetical protein